jgi:hypothetical protein
MATIITVYVTSSGAHLLEPAADAIPYQAELDHEYELKAGAYDAHLHIVGPSTPSVMDAELAIDRGILRVLDPS